MTHLAAAAASRQPVPWIGWAVVIITLAAVARWFARLLKGKN